MKQLFIFLLFTGMIFFSYSQTMQNLVIRLSATVSSGNSGIRLDWVEDTNVTGYNVYKKVKTSNSWGAPFLSLPGNAISWTDTLVQPGQSFEYALTKSGTSFTGYGYIYAGIDLPLVETRGALLLVVDTTYFSQLLPKIERLEKDLRGDGWQVIRIPVNRTDSVPSVKSRIVNAYTSTPGVKTIFLLGRVPVPYSGNIAPDGHTPDHLGAWPADVYYGDINGNWSDLSINNSGASRTENRNVPGDGKFDQSYIASDIELQVGRVDFTNMTTFNPLTEADLLERYLDKNHNWRTGTVTAIDSGIIDDNFGVFSGEAFASSGWRNFGPLAGFSKTAAADFLTTLKGSSTYVWAYGCGAGSYSSASGVGTTSNFAAVGDTFRGVFSMIFGSYHGDWDASNNFMRAALASAGNILTCSWAGRPHWYYHHMGLGENIGYSARISQNYNTLYTANAFPRMIHIALMGDPSLRLHPIATPNNLNLSAVNAGQSVGLNWSPSASSILGYHIYRSPDSTGTFTRITSSIVPDTFFIDSCPLAGIAFYMVRPIALTTSPSGTYYNLGQGICGSINLPGTLNLNAVNPGPYCGGDSIFIAYSNTGAFCAGGMLYAILSDSNSIFSPGDTLGPYPFANGSPAAFRIPTSNPGGSSYRIKLFSVSPAYQTPINTLNIVINPLPDAGFTWVVNGQDVTFSNQSLNALSYNWIFGDGGTDTAYSPTHNFASNGPWTVQLVAQNACGNDTFSVNVSLIGIEKEKEDFAIALFPNPASKWVTLRWPESKNQNITLDVFSPDGKSVFHSSFSSGLKNEFMLPLESFSAGVYKVKLGVGDKIGFTSLHVLK